MLGVYASAAAILLASLVFGTAILRVLGRSTPTPLSGAVGFAALVIACPLLIRLPGRATTLAILLALALLATLAWLRWGTSVPGTERLVSRGRRMRRRRGGRLTGTGAD
jgi:O-antigen ligase